jgi:hypothetical protein
MNSEAILFDYITADQALFSSLLVVWIYFDIIVDLKGKKSSILFCQHKYTHYNLQQQYKTTNIKIYRTPKGH